MASIETIKIRATIEGAGIRAETGGNAANILSFSVRQVRGAPTTFDASIKIKATGSTSPTGDPLTISAGTDSTKRKIFTGMVTKATISPCWDDPSYVIMNLSGADVMYLLEGKKFTRRSEVTQASWVSIEGVNRRGLKSGKFKYRAGKVTHTSAAGLEEDVKVVSVVDMTGQNQMGKMSTVNDTDASQEIVPLIVERVD